MRFGSSCVLSPVASVVRRSSQASRSQKFVSSAFPARTKIRSKNLSHLDSQSSEVIGGLSARASSPSHCLFPDWSAAARTAKASTTTAGRNRERLVVVTLLFGCYREREAPCFASLHAILRLVVPPFCTNLNSDSQSSWSHLPFALLC